ncbi:ferredoxin [Streptomyces sp. Da 82-17]|uniref:ferredoxin n=1 Tax=Streptomyces sp. Da 82-17 TaxID=3377116 RepID=UPI0038D5098A
MSGRQRTAGPGPDTARTTGAAGPQQWRVTVDRACRRTGICTASAPRYFTADEQNRTRVVSELVAPDEDLLAVAESCPAEAISVTDRHTGLPVTDDD